MNDNQHPHPQDDYEAQLARLVEGIEWEKVTSPLVGYSRYRLSRHGRSASRFGKEPEDYAYDAVVSLIGGTRIYPFNNAKVTPLRFLCGVVDSLINHDAERAKRRPQHLFIGNGQGEEAAADECNEEHIASNEDLEREIIAGDRRARFLASLEKPSLKRYAEARIDEMQSTAAEFAAALNVPISEIRNMDRQLSRRREQWNSL